MTSSSLFQHTSLFTQVNGQRILRCIYSSRLWSLWEHIYIYTLIYDIIWVTKYWAIIGYYSSVNSCDYRHQMIIFSSYRALLLFARMHNTGDLCQISQGAVSKLGYKKYSRCPMIWENPMKFGPQDISYHNISLL